jgi:hypothetical protein
MMMAFDDASSEHRGFSELVRFNAWELFGLLLEAHAQWAAKLKHVMLHSGDCSCIPDIARARPPWVARETHYRNLARVLPCSSDTSQSA